MANDRRYKRYFIILENEDRGFEKADKRVPKGYAKIEVRNGKGLLNVYVQDLKYFKDAKYIYRNYLISTKGDKSVFVDTGAFVIDEKGKGELKVKFNPDNVEGSKRTIEDFNVVAVIAKPIERSSEENEIFGPLVGYMDKEKINWKDVVIHENKESEDNDELDEEYKEKYEEIIDVIEKSSKELYKEDAQDNKDNNKKSEKKGYKKEYKNHNKKYDKHYYEDEKEECDDCVDSLEKYDNKKMKVEKKEENKENVKAESKKENKKEINYKHKKYENKEAVKPKENEEVKEESKADKKQKDYKDKKYENKEPVKEEKKEDVKEKAEKVKAEHKEKTKKADTKNYFERKPGVHYKKYHKMVYKYVKDILKYYEKIEPFEKNIKGYSWWKIPYDNQTMHRGFLPFFGYILSSCYFNPYMYYMNNGQNQMNKYGHYIFGVVYDKDMEPKYYVYGVPGRYMYMDQPFQGMTGFVSWYPLEDKTPEQGDYGYWLLHIDAKTGNVVFPIKPTVPPMSRF
ncbi:hypothetical protein R9X47_17230 [Wukongibacter baidiensis]|uniref:hypothetical protein n=1 Tax=Wukongibacter baidiensis TaxID=1723361 RepID=UPI003D7F815F